MCSFLTKVLQALQKLIDRAGLIIFSGKNEALFLSFYTCRPFFPLKPWALFPVCLVVDSACNTAGRNHGESMQITVYITRGSQPFLVFGAL
jgi:hypothetical protein